MSNQKIEKDKGKKEKEPRLQHLIQGQTAEEEFQYILRLISRTPFYKEHGYKVVLPEIEPFLTLDDQSLKGVDEKQLFDIFASQEYREDYYQKATHYLQERIHAIEQKISKPFDTWKQLWDFKTFPVYQILFTKYGTGGTFDEHAGSVLMRVLQDGSFPFPFSMENNTIHEEVHIGIQENIVDRFKLTHLEKEILVNRICMVQFGGTIFDYSARTDDYSSHELYQAVTPESLLHLPSTVESWALSK